MLIPNCNPNLVLLQSVVRDDDDRPVVDQFPIVGWIVEPREDAVLFGGAVDNAKPVVLGEIDTAAWAIRDTSSGYTWMSDRSIFVPQVDPAPEVLLKQAQELMKDD